MALNPEITSEPLEGGSMIRQCMELLFFSVSKDDSDTVQKILSALPVETADPDDSLLLQLLELGLNSGSDSCIQEIITRWDYDDAMPIISRLFLIPGINPEQIKKIIALFEDLDYGSVMIDLMSQPDSDKVQIACNKAREVFGLQTPEVYKALLDYIAKDEGSGGLGARVVKSALEASLSEVETYAPIPSYVKDYLGDTVDPSVSKGPEGLPIEGDLLVSLPEEQPPTFNVPSADDVIRLVLGNTPALRLYSEQQELISLLIASFSSLDMKEKIEALKPLYTHNSSTSTTSDLSIYRLLGPVTMHSGLILDRKDPCSIYGGCRMLVCLEFENTDRERDVISEEPYSFDSEVYWFTGVCDKCRLKIRKPCHAVRRPILTGGWIGCFCSWSCVRKGSPEGKEGLTPNLIFDRFIDQLEKSMNNYGIQDRDYGEDEINATGRIIQELIDE